MSYQKLWRSFLLVGTGTQTATTTPAYINLGGSYGTNTPGTGGNLKIRLYDDGSGGAYNSTTVSRATLGWGTTTLSYTVGLGGTRGGAVGSNQPGTAGGTSSGSGISASGGSGGCGACNGAAGSSSGTTTVNGVEYPSAIGGNFGDSSNPNTNPGSGGGGGNSAFGPFDGKDGRDGAVYFRAYQ